MFSFYVASTSRYDHLRHFKITLKGGADSVIALIRLFMSNFCCPSGGRNWKFFIIWATMMNILDRANVSPGQTRGPALNDSMRTLAGWSAGTSDPLSSRKRSGRKTSGSPQRSFLCCSPQTLGQISVSLGILWPARVVSLGVLWGKQTGRLGQYLEMKQIRSQS